MSFIIERPASRVGTTILEIKDSEVSQLFNKRNLGQDSDFVGDRVQNFLGPAPQSRKFPNFDRLNQLDIEKQGIKIQFGPDTLKKLLNVKIRDPNNSAIIINKQMTFAELLNSQQGIFAGIKASIDLLNQESDRRSQEAIIAIQMLRTFIVQGLSHIEDLSVSQLNTLVSSIDQTSRMPDNPFDAGFESPFIEQSMMTNTLRGEMLLFLLDPRNMMTPLSIGRPVFGVSGFPITTNTMLENLRQGQTLNLLNRTMFRTTEDAVASVENEMGFQPSARIFSRSQFEEEEKKGDVSGSRSRSSFFRTGDVDLDQLIQQQGVRPGQPPTGDEEEEEVNQNIADLTRPEIDFASMTTEELQQHFLQ